MIVRHFCAGAEGDTPVRHCDNVDSFLKSYGTTAINNLALAPIIAFVSSLANVFVKECLWLEIRRFATRAVVPNVRRATLGQENSVVLLLLLLEKRKDGQLDLDADFYCCCKERESGRSVREKEDAGFRCGEDR